MQRYVEHLAATGISLSSVKRYRQILQNFVDFFWVEKGHVKQLSDIATKDIWDYVHYRKRKGIKDKTISNELAEIRKCFRYAVDTNAVSSNPALAVRFKMEQDSTPHYLYQGRYQSHL